MHQSESLNKCLLSAACYFTPSTLRRFRDGQPFVRSGRATGVTSFPNRPSR